MTFAASAASLAMRSSCSANGGRRHLAAGAAKSEKRAARGIEEGFAADAPPAQLAGGSGEAHVEIAERLAATTIATASCRTSPLSGTSRATVPADLPMRSAARCRRFGEAIGKEGEAPCGVALPEEVAGDLGDVMEAPLAGGQRGGARLDRGRHAVERIAEQRKLAGDRRQRDAVAEVAAREGVGGAAEGAHPAQDGEFAQQPGADKRQGRDRGKHGKLPVGAALLAAEHVGARQADGDLGAGLRQLGEGEEALDPVAAAALGNALGLDHEAGHQRMRGADRRADQPRRLRVAREQHAVASDQHDVVLRALRLALGAALNLGEVDGSDDSALRRAGEPPPGESQRAAGRVELKLADRKAMAGEKLVEEGQRRKMPLRFRLAGAQHDAVAVDDVDLRRPCTPPARRRNASPQPSGVASASAGSRRAASSTSSASRTSAS